MSAYKPYPSREDSNARSGGRGSADKRTSADASDDIEQMLSSLPDVGEEAPVEASQQALQSEFDRMLSSLPEEDEAESDFELRHGAKLAPRSKTPRGTTPLRDRPTPPPQGPLSSGALPRYASDAGAGRAAGAAARLPKTPDAKAPPAPTAGPEPKADIFGGHEDAAAAFLLEPTPAPTEPRPATSRPTNSGGRRSAGSGYSVPTSPAPEATSLPAINEGALSRRILDELEKYSIPSVSQLRVAVHGSTVTIIGDVPTDYERKLVMHFTQKVSGITEVVDMMRVAGGQGLTSGPDVPGARIAPLRPTVRRRSGPGLQLNFPFQAKHVGIVAGLLVMIWAGYSFATRDGSKASVYPVTGKVLFDGTAPEGANIVLHPQNPEQTVRPRGFVGKDGSFQLTTYLPADGAPPGDYKLTIEWNRPVEVPGGDFIPGPNLLPAALSKPDTTTLKVTILSGKTELDPVNITKTK